MYIFSAIFLKRWAKSLFIINFVADRYVVCQNILNEFVASCEPLSEIL